MKVTLITQFPPMRMKTTLTAVTLAALVLLGAGCSQKSTEPANTSNGDTSSTSKNTNVANADTCGNPYYPFKKGLTIAYKVTPAASGEGSSDYTIRTIDVVGTKAIVQTELFGGIIADMEADCASGSVELKGSSGLGSAMEGVQFKTEVVSSSGTTMPANVSAGKTWDHSETIKMEVTGGENVLTGSTITMTTTEQSKAIGEESITVPAGTYKAMKIELTRTTQGEMTGAQGANLIKIPSSTDTSTEWWVKGIGMVKSVTVSKDGTTTTVAKSVSGL